MLFFVVGFLVGFVGPSAGVGGGVLFTPLAVGLLGVDVNLARTGGLLVAMTTSSVAGSLYLWRGVANLRLVAYAGAAMSLGAFLGARLGLFLTGVEGAGGLWRWGWGLSSSWWFLFCWVGGWSGLRGVSTGSPSGLGL
jgi:hypothetical protein